MALLSVMTQSRVGVALYALWMLAVGAAAQTLEGPDTPAPYALVHGSYLIDDCPPCGRPTIIQPMQGSFLWQEVAGELGTTRYELRQIHFSAGNVGGQNYQITGHGTYTRFNTTPPTQQTTMEVVIDNGLDRVLCQLTNSSTAIERRLPMLDIPLVQTNGTFTQVFHLQLNAAPLNDLWFSTGSGLTDSFWNPPTNRVTSGDLLSFRGQVARRNGDLTSRLGLLALSPDPGLDAVGLSTNGTLVFSMERDVFSDRHGWLRQGDLVSETGRLVRRNADLYAAFQPQPGTAPVDYGLDAVHMRDTGEIWFSVRTDFFSERLGQALRRGDLLSELGVVVRTQESLLAHFHPSSIKEDYGLDAIHVWPSGEIWFSVERGFFDRELGPIGPGDLLSDEGYIVFLNRELIAPFSPLEDLADFGLDAVLALPHSLAPVTPEAEPDPLSYQLLDGGRLADELSPSSGTSAGFPMRGSFQLRESRDGLVTGQYAIQNVHFVSKTPQGRTYSVDGHGTLRIVGLPALVQDAQLEVFIDDGAVRRLCLFTNSTPLSTRPWPMIQLHFKQSNPVPGQYYELVLAAAPFEELWFSTRYGFQPGPSTLVPDPISDGDLLSNSGRVVKRNYELTARLGFMPVVPDLGLDALDLLPGGGLLFSTVLDQFSESLGQIHDGDLVTDRGTRVPYTRLLAEFEPEPPVWDEGLDAVHTTGSLDGEILFSVKHDFNSIRLGKKVRRGDLLSSRGLIHRTNEALLARFRPVFADRDYGLDAAWTWPSGEIWFSTEEGFLDQNYDSVGPGDILSDQGYIVYRNRELLGRFAPVDDRLDFGLDALVVITTPGSSLSPPRVTSYEWDPLNHRMTLRWIGPGSVFQVERATRLEGPFEVISEWIPDLQFTDNLAPVAGALYRIRQW